MCELDKTATLTFLHFIWFLAEEVITNRNMFIYEAVHHHTRIINTVSGTTRKEPFPGDSSILFSRCWEKHVGSYIPQKHTVVVLYFNIVSHINLRQFEGPMYHILMFLTQFYTFNGILRILNDELQVDSQGNQSTAQK